MSKQRRNALLAGAVLGLLAIGLVGYRLWLRDEGTVRADSPGDRLAAVQVHTLDGREFTLGALRDQVVLVNFWATWCGTCRSEMPGFQAVYEGYRDRGFTIVALSVDDGQATVRDFFREHGYTFPVAMSTEDAARAFRVSGIPVSFLVDQNGEIRQTVHGAFHEADLREAVEGLLAEAPSDEGSAE